MRQGGLTRAGMLGATGLLLALMSCGKTGNNCVPSPGGGDAGGSPALTGFHVASEGQAPPTISVAPCPTTTTSTGSTASTTPTTPVSSTSPAPDDDVDALLGPDPSGPPTTPASGQPGGGDDLGPDDIDLDLDAPASPHPSSRPSQAPGTPSGAPPARH